MVESAFPGGASVQLALSPWHRAGHLALRLPVHTSIARIWSATVSNVSGCVARIQLADYPSTTLGMILRSHHSGEDAPIDWSHAIELLGADGLPCTMHRVCGSGDCAHGAAYPYVAAVALQLDGAAAPDPEECQQMGRLMSELLPHPAHHDASLGASLTARNPASYLTTLPTPDGSVLVVFSLAQPQDVTTLAATLRERQRAAPLFALPQLGRRLGRTLRHAMPIGLWATAWEVVTPPRPHHHAPPWWVWLLAVGGGLLLLGCCLCCYVAYVGGRSGARKGFGADRTEPLVPAETSAAHADDARDQPAEHAADYQPMASPVAASRVN
jgi:hypothetical protein